MHGSACARSGWRYDRRHTSLPRRHDAAADSRQDPLLPPAMLAGCHRRSRGGREGGGKSSAIVAETLWIQTVTSHDHRIANARSLRISRRRANWGRAGDHGRILYPPPITIRNSPRRLPEPKQFRRGPDSRMGTRTELVALLGSGRTGRNVSMTLRHLRNEFSVAG